MHEISVAAEIVRHVSDVASRRGLGDVDEVHVAIGPLAWIDADALAMAFEVAARDTPAENARLRVEELALQATCRQCRRAFTAEVDDLRCPQCGQADVSITAGSDVVVTSLVCRSTAGALVE